MSFLAVLGSSWRQPDHFDWLSSYLKVQRLRGLTRVMMVAVIVLVGVAPLVMHWSPGGPADGLPTIVSIIIAVITAGLAMLWIWRWPSRRQSVAFAMTATVCIGVACLLDRDPGSGLLGCAVFAAIAGYVAFFHSSRHLVAVIVIAVSIATVDAVRIGLAGDPAAAISKYLVILVGVLAVPSSVQILVQLLGSDAAESDLDSLTGAHNRRGFYRGAHDLVVRARDDAATVGLILVDLDGFKRVNDTRGHAAGDALLVAVSDVLRRCAADLDAITARFGGEEFVVLGTLDTAAADDLAERVRTDVAALPDALTVSIGVAGSAVAGAADTEIRPILDRLVDAADDAMYDAKRSGGNRVRHSGRPAGPGPGTARD